MPTRDGRTECRRDRCEQYPRLQVAVARGDVARRVQPARVALVPRRATTTGHAALERLLRGGVAMAAARPATIKAGTERGLSG